jgi:hypothetical protein
VQDRAELKASAQAGSPPAVILYALVLYALVAGHYVSAGIDDGPQT